MGRRLGTRSSPGDVRRRRSPGSLEWNGPPEEARPPDGSLTTIGHWRPRGGEELLRRHRHQVIPRAGDEVGELHLGDGRGPSGRRRWQPPTIAVSEERGVDHAPGNSSLEAERDLEGPAVDADVLVMMKTARSRRISCGRRPRSTRYVLHFGHGSPVVRGVEVLRPTRTHCLRASRDLAAGTSAAGSGVVEQRLTTDVRTPLFVLGQLGVVVEPALCKRRSGPVRGPCLEHRPSARRRRRRGTAWPSSGASGT